MGWIEAAATIFGLTCVWLTIRQNTWCWPTGLIQVLLFIYIFHAVKLYSDLILHVIYVFMQIYGWHYWLHGGRNRAQAAVTRLRRSVCVAWIGVGIVATAGWGWGMGRYTDAALPYPDAFTTVISLIAQWLMARKKLESWLFWIAVDVVAIWVYAYKHLYLTTGLYAVFLVLAARGWFVWRTAWLAGHARGGRAETAG
jgi:nicotinamide mononucleotide transporter